MAAGCMGVGARIGRCIDMTSHGPRAVAALLHALESCAGYLALRGHDVLRQHMVQSQPSSVGR